jgi:hypothetical protein
MVMEISHVTYMKTLPVLLILALIIMQVKCSDPDPLQDLCIAETTSKFFINDFPCMNPSTVMVSQFKTSTLGVPGNTNANRFDFNVTLTTVKKKQKTVGIQYARNGHISL